MINVSASAPFLFDSIRSRLGRGVLLCDPERINEVLEGGAVGRDLSRDFFADDGKNVFAEGAAVGFFQQEYEECLVTVRAPGSRSNLSEPAPNLSEGWVLGTRTGNLVLCSVDALLFWDPYERDEYPQRFVRFSVPPGWYQVTICSDRPRNSQEQLKDNVEFVLTHRLARPHFAAVVFDTPSDETTAVSVPEPGGEGSNVSQDAVDTTLARAVLSQLTSAAFKLLVSKLFNRDEPECEPLGNANDLGGGVFYQPLLDSYGASLKSVFVLQYVPLNLFKRPQIGQLAGDPSITVQLESIRREFNGVAGYIGMVSPELVKATRLRSIGFLLNISGVSEREYMENIIPQYAKLVRDVGVNAPMVMVGSYDSFLDFSALSVQEILTEFLTNRVDGFAVQIGPGRSRGLHFSAQTSFESGVLESNQCPYEPVLSPLVAKHQDVIREFEFLIETNAPEKKLEAFLIDHANDIFGSRYDRIEPQIWLRFPELDIAGKERRIDLFMRNSISADWELFEIKKPIDLVRNFREGPAMVADVAGAITQLKRYARLLSTPQVKEKLKLSGIEYFEPTLNLVIGRRPQISLDRWRWLVESQDKDVRLTTFDDLVAEMSSRLTDSIRFIGQLGGSCDWYMS